MTKSMKLEAMLALTVMAYGCINNDTDTDNNVNEVPLVQETGTLDTGVYSVWFADNDGDGFGNPNVSMKSVDQPSGYVLNKEDCDDTNNQINPSMVEICDGLDNNCDGVVDADAINRNSWYMDLDNDNYGDELLGIVLSCDKPLDFVTNLGDCNENDPNINPGMPEVCDGYDNNCDGVVDTDAINPRAWYADADGDGFGNPEREIISCNQPLNYVMQNSQDCDDTNGQINPSMVEICDGWDNNCDGVVDTDAIDMGVWYADADSDGFGNPLREIISCVQPQNYVLLDNRDCDDLNSTIHPEQGEICNGLDDNCNGFVDDMCM